MIQAVQMLVSPAAMWGLVAAVPAVTNEYLYRRLASMDGSWLDWWYVWIPSQLLISYAIWRLVTVPQTTLMDAFVIWALSTTALRVFASVVLLNDPVRGGTWFALGLLIMARIAQTYWGR